MGETNRIAVPAWIIAVLGSFAVSVELGGAAVVGLLGQWFLKAPSGFPTWLAQLLILVVVVGGYWLLHPTWPLTQSFMVSAAGWGLSALGISSLSAGTGGAPTTNSK
jgi:hypothetical protein